MTVLFHLWRKAADDRNRLARELDQLRLDLAIERQRSTAAAMALTEPCERCRLLEDERDEALLQLDAVQGTLMWLERDFKTA